MVQSKKRPDISASQLYDALVEALDDLIFVADRDGRYLLFNESGLRRCGFTQNDVLGKTPVQAFGRELGIAFQKNNQEVLDSGRSLVLQEWIPLEDGLRCISTQLIPIGGNPGKPLAVMGIGRDITETKRMMEEISISTSSLESPFKQRIHNEKIVKDILREETPNSPIDSFLGAVTRILGEGLAVSRSYIFEYDQIRQKAKNTHEWVAEGIEPLIDQMQDLPVSSQPWASGEMLAGRSVCVDAADDCPSTELRELLDAQGVRSTLMIPIFTFGQPYGFIGFDECTEKGLCKEIDMELLHGIVRIVAQKIERSRLEMDALAAERLAAVGRLTASFTHEINNPLQSILLHLEGLKDHVDDAGRRKLDFISEGFDRIAGIVTRLMNVKKCDAEMLELDINGLLQNAYKLVSHRIDSKGMSVRWNLDDSLPAFFGNGDKLHQVFLNVILNACDSMDKGGVLDIVSSSNGCHLEIVIQDTGCGIEAEALPYVFEPFYTTKGKSGTGLGLFVSHSIIAEHEGKIEVQSVKGSGTRVTILLPLDQKCKHVKRRE